MCERQRTIVGEKRVRESVRARVTGERGTRRVRERKRGRGEEGRGRKGDRLSASERDGMSGRDTLNARQSERKNK